MSKIWFITGAGSGIGAGIAKAALQAGNRVVATGRNLDKVRSAYSDAERENITFLPLDVTDAAQANAAIEATVQQFGRVDVLVNNAGFSVLGNFEELSVADIESQLATNFYGVVHPMRAALPVMRKQRAGHIINLSSVAGVVAFKECSAYSASKFAVEGLSLCVSQEVEPFGIKVTVVEPGFFRTDLLASQNVRYNCIKIADYAAHGDTQETWSAYDGQQQGDPLKLGEALVKIVGLENPPKIFAAGADALATITPAIEERLKITHAHEDISTSTDGSF